MKRTYALMGSLIAAALLTACSTAMPSRADLDKLTQDIVARSFRAEGQAQLDRMDAWDD